MRRRHRIAVDLIYYTGTKGGMETYARGLFRELGQAAPDLAFVGLTNAEIGSRAPEWFPGPVRPLAISGENRLTWAAAEAFMVGPIARRLGADLLHCPANFGPVVRRLPTVLTIHDLLPHRHPELVPRGLGRGVACLVAASARAATRIIADSQATATDVRTFLGVSDDRLDVVPLASTAPPPGMSRASALHAQVTSDRPFVLTSGNRMPHKNFTLLLEAWARLASHQRPFLVIPGSHGDDPLEPLVAQLGLADDVLLLGWVESTELDALYDAALFYVCPSLFEGFGLPVLEAMQRGCPVIASDIAVLREIGGDAVRWFDPSSADALRAAVASLSVDAGERERLTKLGLDRAQEFSWRRCAEHTAETYRRALP